MERRLAAILSVDVVGYSRLMEVDEEGTHETLRKRRQEFLEPLIDQYHGRVVKLTGDGALVEYASAVDAVHCARTMQQRMAELNEGLPEERHILFRMGVNVGDIIIDDGDIYGTGVNVAARLQEMADPGGIYVSKAVVDYVHSLADLSFRYIGERQVKNLSSAVGVYSIQPADGAPTGAALRFRRRRRAPRGAALAAAVLAVCIGGALAWYVRSLPPPGPPLPDVPSVAVLPFANLSHDPEQQYLANGIAEDLITSLARVPDFFVIARQSAFQLAGASDGVRQVGQDLGVRYVVDGSVQRSGNLIRITAQLVDAVTGRSLWADRFDREVDEIFQIQDSVTEAVAATLMGTTGLIATAELGRLSAKSPKTFGAYDYLMRGWDAWYTFTRDGNAEARRLFERARDLDPDYARAYAGIAWTHALDYEYDWTDSYDEVVETALSNARTAVALDDRDYRSYWILGWAHLYSWQHGRAEAAYNRARDLNPNDAELMAEMASLLIYVGRADQAVAQLKEAIRRNPLHDRWYLEYLGWAYEEAGMPDQCIEVLEKVIDPQPSEEQLWLLRTIAACYADPSIDRMDDAHRVADTILELDPEFSMAAHKAYVEEVFPYESQDRIDRWIGAFSRVGLPD